MRPSPRPTVTGSPAAPDTGVADWQRPDRCPGAGTSAPAHHRDRPEADGAFREPRRETHTSAGVRASLLEYLHACPICAGGDLRHYCRVPSLFNPGEHIRYERCAGCGTVLRNPRLPAAYRLDRYERCIVPAAEKRLDAKRQTHYRYMLRAIDRLLPPGSGRRLLDFGCGAGAFLVAARAAGFDAVGLELNRDLARHVSHQHGIPVYQGLVDDPAFAGERFNAILSSQVFEHLLDPRYTLRALRAHLAPPGLLLLEVPNLSDIRERLRRGSTMDDSHLFYFNRRSLARLLADAGFEVREVHEGLRPCGLLGRLTGLVPDPVLRAGERLLSAAGIKTGLGIIAALRTFDGGIS